MRRGSRDRRALGAARRLAEIHRATDRADAEAVVREVVTSVWGGLEVWLVSVTPDLTTWDRRPLEPVTTPRRLLLDRVLDAIAVGPPGPERSEVSVVTMGDATAVPVRSAGAVVAAIVTLGAVEVRRDLDAVLDVAASHIGVATERHWELRALRSRADRLRVALDERAVVAEILQRALLPPSLPMVGDVLLGATYRPMVEDIGGDFYEVFPMRDHMWGLVLGDVCGKGPEAASITALARSAVRSLVIDAARPDKAAQVLNRLLVEERVEERSALCSAIVGTLEVQRTGIRVELVVAGHPAPVVLRRGGGHELIEQTGPILGVWDAIEVSSTILELAPGDTCVLYTDGATDVLDSHGHVFGEDRLLEVIDGCRGMHPAMMAKAIEEAVADHQRGVISDDLAVLVVAAPMS